MTANTPEDLDRLLETAMAAGDVQTLVSLYEANAVFADEGVVKMQGRASFEAGFANLARQKLNISGNPRVIANFGDIAVMYNDWTETGVGKDGEPFERSGKAIEVVRRQPDGTWKFLFDDPYGRG
jgi:ketosteroid isomerase-like protein